MPGFDSVEWFVDGAPCGTLTAFATVIANDLAKLKTRVEKAKITAD